MALSDQLEDLAGKTKKLEDTAAVVRAKNTAKLEQQRDQFHAAVETQTDKVRAKAAQTKTDAQEWWAQINKKMEQRRAELQTKHEQHKAERAADTAEWQAEAAEDYASTIATIAAYLVDEAAYSALDATLLRQQADAKMKEAVKAGS